MTNEKPADSAGFCRLAANLCLRLAIKIPKPTLAKLSVSGSNCNNKSARVINAEPDLLTGL